MENADAVPDKIDYSKLYYDCQKQNGGWRGGELMPRFLVIRAIRDIIIICKCEIAIARAYPTASKDLQVQVCLSLRTMMFHTLIPRFAVDDLLATEAYPKRGARWL